MAEAALAPRPRGGRRETPRRRLAGVWLIYALEGRRAASVQRQQRGWPGGQHGLPETTATGQARIADVSVYCDACGAEGHTWLRTDANGYYSFSGDLDSRGGIWLSNGPTVLLVAKEGFDDPDGQRRGSSGDSRREIIVSGGDTRYDIQLVRR